MSSDARPTFTWLGHATVRCDLPGGEVVLIDPFLEGNPSCPDSGKRVRAARPRSSSPTPTPTTWATSSGSRESTGVR